MVEPKQPLEKVLAELDKREEVEVQCENIWVKTRKVILPLTCMLVAPLVILLGFVFDLELGTPAGLGAITIALLWLIIHPRSSCFNFLMP